MVLSDKQQAAVESQQNALVSAGAGSGKTRVLVERCLNQVLKKGIPLKNILIITFMKDAAAEMKKRIREGLSEALDAELCKTTSTPAEEKNRQERLNFLEEQLAQLEEASISTIHSFCYKLLNENFDLLSNLQCPLKSHLRVLDEAMAYRLKKEAFANVMRRHYSLDKKLLQEKKPADPVVLFLRNYLENNEKRLSKMVFTLYDFTQSLAAPEKWLSQQEALFNKETPQNWMDLLYGTGADCPGELLPFLSLAKDQIWGKKTDEKVKALFQRVLKNVSPEGKENPIDILINYRNDYSGKRDYFVAKSINEPLHKLLNFYSTFKEDWKATARTCRLLIELVREFEKEFIQQKQLTGGITYGDQLQFAHSLLCDPHTQQPTPLAQSLSQHFQLIFVDEFQDTDGIQNAIISALSHNNCFLVGDVKQSIYRFRLADPSIFRKYEDKACHSVENWTRYPLNENYRSQPDIIYFVNALFKDLMHEKVGGVEFDETALLLPRIKKIPSQEPRVQMLWNIEASSSQTKEAPNDKEDGSENEDLSKVEREAILIAKHLLKMKGAVQLANPGGDCEESSRPMQWSDVTLLCRGGLLETAPVYIRVFESYGIPLAAPGIDLFACVEIQDLLNLITLFDNPDQDFPLMGVLRSPFVGVTLTEFTQLRTVLEHDSLWTVLRHLFHHQPAPDLPEELVQKLKTFLIRFKNWRNRLKLLSLSQLLEEILEETAYEVSFAALPFPEQKLKNVRRFLSIVETFDPFRRQGVRRFLDYVESLRQGTSDDNTSSDSTSGVDAVQIRSIHRSKGLEFPIVFLIGMGKKINNRFMDCGVGLDSQFGLFTKTFDKTSEGTLSQKDNLGIWLAQRRYERENKGEELRILYVALTRACEYLVLCGTHKVKVGEKDDSLKEKKASCELTPLDSIVLKNSSFKDWICTWLAHIQKDLFDSVDSTTPSTTTLKLPVDGANSIPIGIEFHPADDQSIPPPSPLAPETRALSKDQLKAQLKKLKAKLDWHYPHWAVVTVFAKNSVTGLMHDLRGKEAPPSNHSYKNSLQNVQRSAERGTAYHRVMECLNMKPQFAEEPPELEFYEEERQRMLHAGLITEEQSKVVELEDICAFWKTEEGRQFLSQWNCVEREVPFTFKINASELESLGFSTPLQGTEETVILQGTVDLMMRNEKEIWVLDYKTDTLKASEFKERVLAHKPQVESYSLILHSIYHLPVTHRYLAFLRNGKIESL